MKSARVAIGRNGEQFSVGLVWVVRDTKANRELLRRYAGSFDTRFPGSSAHWVNAISRGSDFPAQPGLVWCDVNRTRLFARRSSRIQA